VLPPFDELRIVELRMMELLPEPVVVLIICTSAFTFRLKINGAAERVRRIDVRVRRVRRLITPGEDLGVLTCILGVRITVPLGVLRIWMFPANKFRSPSISLALTKLGDSNNVAIAISVN